ncbi:NADPH:adrenodoxin oxidoreductase, mitochondrial isoform X2 [Aphidius gifuensis]|nr:NADPH:adrenodoxin oxidoreductase, mitochondrial isoform X2 [Aphidius gifuensis]
MYYKQLNYPRSWKNFDRPSATVSITVNKLFTKYYELIIDNDNYKLPLCDNMFIEEPWEINDLKLIKKNLNEMKSRLNDYNLMEWQYHTRKRNQAGDVQWRLRRDISPEFLTQAWCKFYENVSSFPLVPDVSISNEKFKSLHLCEAPGAFIASLNHWLKLNSPNIKWNWIGTTLNPHYEGNSLSTMIKDDRFILHTMNNWYFGVDNTGDLMKLNNLDGLIERVGDDVMLVTADGSINCMDSPDEQELVVSHLHYCETIAALNILNIGGSYLLKLFTIFEHQTICLIYLLSCTFKRIIFNKPVTSKEGGTMNGINLLKFISNYCTSTVTPKVCIVGSGPAGFYAAQQLLKSSSDVHVDIYERLPVPYGLVRFGVAPDHPDVKNVINTFKKIAVNSRVKFLGNVDIGKDVTVKQLQENYHAVLLTYGAEEDRSLGIPGENLSNVLSSRQFVGWYNGLPSDKNLKINLDVEEAVVVGQGNVAIDVARMLLTPIDELAKTDITAHSLEQLSKSKIKKVWMIGRRGPLQAAFTIAELREMTKLKNCKTSWRMDDFNGVSEMIPNLPRPRKRLTELMINNLNDSTNNHDNLSKEFAPIFLRGPKEIIGNEFVEKIRLSINVLEGTDYKNQQAKDTLDIEDINCGLVLRSIGYKSRQIDQSIPFDIKKGKIISSNGFVNDNLYAAGWLSTGPVGVILSTMNDAIYVGGKISKDLDLTTAKSGSYEILKILEAKNIRSVSFDDWEKIDKIEISRGKDVGKPREKIVDVSEMLEIAFS